MEWLSCQCHGKSTALSYERDTLDPATMNLPLLWAETETRQKTQIRKINGKCYEENKKRESKATISRESFSAQTMKILGTAFPDVKMDASLRYHSSEANLTKAPVKRRSRTHRRHPRYAREQWRVSCRWHGTAEGRRKIYLWTRGARNFDLLESGSVETSISAMACFKESTALFWGARF